VFTRFIWNTRFKRPPSNRFNSIIIFLFKGGIIFEVFPLNIMADLDSLIGSKISLISQQDIKYDGVLFSINAAESSIVLRDGEQFLWSVCFSYVQC